MRLNVNVMLGFVLAFMLGAGFVWAQGGYLLSGHVSATDSEVDEGFFGVGQETSIVAKPGSGAHKWLKEHTGQRIRVTLEIDTDSVH